MKSWKIAWLATRSHVTRAGLVHGIGRRLASGATLSATVA